MTKIVAHRGASAEAPENTLAAFAKAIEAGADMIEFDVRRSGDGTLVISHDPIQGHTQGLLSLEETLQASQGKIQLDVELKEPGCERDALDLLLRYFKPDQFCITSFVAPTLRSIKAAHPEVRTGFIFEEWNEGVQAACATGEVDLLAPHFSLIDQAEKLGKPLFPWTVDDPAVIRALLRRPAIEGIITNNPRRAVALRMECCLH